jgi:hypothetical protein
LVVWFWSFGFGGLVLVVWFFVEQARG